MLTREQILKVQRMDRQYGGGDRDASCTSLRSGTAALIHSAARDSDPIDPILRVSAAPSLG